ncbi:hypothetical protein HDV05_003504 [Chytridiales sp. JEL 0842]|nr:hypothetical protein HDV05_003504 [Chytridiales sp. JEL 0842]
MKPKTLLLFIHGFLGSSTSFATFPAELLQTLSNNYALTDLEAKVLPTFDSKEDIGRVLEGVCGWLLENAGSPERLLTEGESDREKEDDDNGGGYEGVVLVGHSMGGLLAVDAMRKLYELQNTLPDTNKDDSTTNSAPSTPDPNKVTDSIKKKKKGKVNIISILAFDSPFFGLNPLVLTSEAPQHVSSLVRPYVPPLPPLPQIQMPDVQSVGRSVAGGVGTVAGGVVGVVGAVGGVVGGLVGGGSKKKEVEEKKDETAEEKTGEKEKTTEDKKEDRLVEESKVEGEKKEEGEGVDCVKETDEEKKEGDLTASAIITLDDVVDDDSCKLKGAKANAEPAVDSKLVYEPFVNSSNPEQGVSVAAVVEVISTESAPPSDEKLHSSSETSLHTSAATAVLDSSTDSDESKRSQTSQSTDTPPAASENTPSAQTDATPPTSKSTQPDTTSTPPASTLPSKPSSAQSSSASLFFQSALQTASFASTTLLNTTASATRQVYETASATLGDPVKMISSKVIQSASASVGNAAVVGVGAGVSALGAGAAAVGSAVGGAASTVGGVASAVGGAAVGAVGAVGGAVGSLVPRLTMGRAAMLGVGGVVWGLAAVGAKVREEEAKKKALEKETTTNVEAAGDVAVGTISSSEDDATADTSSKLVGVDVEDIKIDENASKIAAEETVMETTMLIAAAALEAQQEQQELETEGATEGGEAETEEAIDIRKEEEMALERIEKVDREVGRLLKKVSKSVLKAQQELQRPDIFETVDEEAAMSANTEKDGLVETFVDGSPAVPLEWDDDDPQVDSAKTSPTNDTTLLVEVAASAEMVTSTAMISLDQDPSQQNEADTLPSESAVEATQPAPSWTPWITLGLAGAALTAGAYYTGGLSLAAPLVQRVAMAWAIGHASEASKHLRFLRPLWNETKLEREKRMETLREAVEKGGLHFKCFYVELPPPYGKGEEGSAVKKTTEDLTKVDQPSEASAAEKVAASVTPKDSANASTFQPAATPISSETPTPSDKSDTKKEPSKSDSAKHTAQQARTFISPPPQNVCHLFRPVPSDAPDVIAAHMTMFERSQNAGGYWIMVDEAAAAVYHASPCAPDMFSICPICRPGEAPKGIPTPIRGDPGRIKVAPSIDTGKEFDAVTAPAKFVPLLPPPLCSEDATEAVELITPPAATDPELGALCTPHMLDTLETLEPLMDLCRTGGNDAERDRPYGVEKAGELDRFEFGLDMGESSTMGISLPPDEALADDSSIPTIADAAADNPAEWSVRTLESAPAPPPAAAFDMDAAVDVGSANLGAVGVTGEGDGIICVVEVLEDESVVSISVGTTADFAEEDVVVEAVEAIELELLEVDDIGAADEVAALAVAEASVGGPI